MAWPLIAAITEVITTPLHWLSTLLHSIRTILDYNYNLVSFTLSQIYSLLLYIARAVNTVALACYLLFEQVVTVLLQVYHFGGTVWRSVTSVCSVAAETAQLLASSAGHTLSTLSSSVSSASKSAFAYAGRVGEHVVSSVSGVLTSAVSSAWSLLVGAWTTVADVAAYVHAWGLDATYYVSKSVRYAGDRLVDTGYECYVWLGDGIVSVIVYLRVHVRVVWVVVVGLYHSVPLYLHLSLLLAIATLYYRHTITSSHAYRHFVPKVRRNMHAVMDFIYANVYIPVFRGYGSDDLPALMFNVVDDDDDDDSDEMVIDLVDSSDTATIDYDEDELEVIDVDDDDSDTDSITTTLTTSTTAHSSHQAPPCAGDDDDPVDLDDVGDARERLKLERSRRLCVVCLMNEKKVMLSPCNHLCLCNACAQQWSLARTRTCRVCPVCRARVRDILRVYV